MRDLDFVLLAVLILGGEFLCKLSQLLQGDVAEGKDFLLDVVDIVDETLERDEFLEGDLTLQLHLVYAFQVPRDLVGWEADEEGLSKILKRDRVLLFVDNAILMELVVAQGGLQLLTEVSEVTQGDVLLSREESC